MLVVPNDGLLGKEHPSRAFLVVETARSSLRRDQRVKTVLYGLAEVDEYWIINQVDDVVEIYRDRHDGQWRSKQTLKRGDTVALVAFPDVVVEIAAILAPKD